jgi:hypothetical protein
MLNRGGTARWLRGGGRVLSETLETFRRDGVVVLEQFCSSEEVARMKGRMAELIDKWDPAEAKVCVRLVCTLLLCAACARARARVCVQGEGKREGCGRML